MRLLAVILAGGYGSRLMPFTATTPKHLLPIGDEPVIAHQLHRLRRAGIDDVTLATSYHADAFRPVLGDGDRYGVRLRYSREENPLGTGGGLRAAYDVSLEDGTPDAVVVLNGDLITEHDLRAQIRAHVAAEPLATVHGRFVEDASPFGLLHVDGTRVERFEEKPDGHPSGLVNAGTYVVSPELINTIPAGDVVSLERDVFDAATRRDPGVRVYPEDAVFADIGTPAALLEANVRWARDHPDQAAGDDSVICSDDVAADAVVEQSLVLHRARIGAGARVVGSIIGQGAVVAPGCQLVNAVIAPGERCEPA